MATFAAIRAGLKTNLATISGLNAYATIPDNPVPPFAVVGAPFGNEYQVNYGARNGPQGATEWILPIRVGVGATDSISAQGLLDVYLAASGSTSIKAAVEGKIGAGSKTLGGAADAVRVVKAENYGGFGPGILGVEFRVEVLSNG